MKYTAYRFLLLLIAAVATTPAKAQMPEAEDMDTLTIRPEWVNVAFRKVEKQDLQGGISSYSIVVCWRKIIIHMFLTVHSH